MKLRYWWLLLLLLTACQGPGTNRVLRSVEVGTGRSWGGIERAGEDTDTESSAIWFSVQPLAWLEDEPQSQECEPEERDWRPAIRPASRPEPPPVIAPAPEPAPMTPPQENGSPLTVPIAGDWNTGDLATLLVGAFAMLRGYKAAKPRIVKAINRRKKAC